MWWKLAVAAVQIAAAFVSWAQEQRWYQEGVQDGIAEQQAADAAAKATLEMRYAQIAAADMSPAAASEYLRALAGNGGGGVSDLGSAP